MSMTTTIVVMAIMMAVVILKRNNRIDNYGGDGDSVDDCGADDHDDGALRRHEIRCIGVDILDDDDDSCIHATFFVLFCFCCCETTGNNPCYTGRIVGSVRGV